MQIVDMELPAGDAILGAALLQQPPQVQPSPGALLLLLTSGSQLVTYQLQQPR
jgi:hypothetical protein